MSIRCGNHEVKTYHETVDQVRACFAGATADTPRFNDVYVTDEQLMKVVEGVREMEDEGILPRRGGGYGIEDARRDLTATRAAVADLPAPGVPAEPRLSPKGNVIPEEYQGSPKQYDYMLSMLKELGQDDTYDWSLIHSVRKASMTIESLKDKVRDHRRMARVTAQDAVATKREPVRQTVTGQVAEDGIYRNPETGELFKVQVAVHGSGQLYAKQAVITEGDWHDGAAFELTAIPLEGDGAVGRLDWVYKPGLLSKIKAEWKVTREEAVAFGALYGQCIRCGRTLTNEESIEAAIGPICRGKLGF